ncbi:MAG TPA: DUF2264 domain-containing protein, partial [Anaerolineae bacterium]|nr:DUF2264 domain-containing protein [Anaerolineae bacterium]
SFARMASAWGAWLRNPQNPATVEFCNRTLNLEEILTQALLDGTNPNNPRTYWGDMHDMDQRIVEAADIALTLWLSRERVFNRLTENERAKIIHWLEQVDAQDVYYDNWILFPVLPMTVRYKLGYPVDLADLDARLDQMAAFYRGDGWYVDGAGTEYELYNAWMFGWHYLLWAWIDGARRPDYTEKLVRRARSFLAGFQYFFGANGSYTAWGRSIVYRFAAISCFAASYLLKISPLSPGALRRVSSGCINYFYQHDAIDPTEHFLRQGFHGDFPPAAEAYISPGSPYWACHGLFALTFDRADPFWSDVEEPLPIERQDFELALPTPGFLLSGQRATGQVVLLNAGSGHQPENPRHNYITKYGKFAYSTHFPFNVLTAGHTYAPDAMISLTHDDKTFSHRFTNRAHGVAPGFSWSEFVEYVDDEPQLLRVAILLYRDIQIRLTYLQPTRRARVVQAPGALGCTGAASVTRRSNPTAGWEYAQAEGRALAIQRLHGYDAQRASEPFLGYSNINLAYPYAEQPLVIETAPSNKTRSFAAASLLRPAPFDPNQEFTGITIDAQQGGAFNVHLPNGDQAFVSLANELPTQLDWTGHSVTGDAIRYLRANHDLTHITTIGVTNFDKIFQLDHSGTIQLPHSRTIALSHERTTALSPYRTLITTNTGFQLDPSWLQHNITRIEASELDGRWTDITNNCQPNRVPNSLVQHWSHHNERTFIEFRLTHSP